MILIKLRSANSEVVKFKKKGPFAKVYSRESFFFYL